MSRCILLLAGLVAALMWAASTPGAVSQTVYVYFDVDGGMQIRYADSSAVGSTIPPGSYTINLNSNGADDYAVDHIFHLTGPGVDYKAANTNTVASFPVTFQSSGTYVAQDDLDPKIRQAIVATNGAAAPTPAPVTTTPVTSTKKPTSSDIVGSEAALPFRGALDAIVYSGGKLSLTKNGKKVTSLKNGRYTFSVDDESKKRGSSVQVFHGKAVVLTTGVYTGTHDKTVSLKAGRWSFFSPGGVKLTFFVTT